ncbi:MAG TPA: hypothetical protein DD381_10595 [Lentisphaeria bacterium]|nr:MAG: hypothetical protein A2X47_02075 [Lentisphaerae bacterium GWF2_38_69]HBM16775.1 hypothetical protein [Lentisphaeria bacterium]
MKIKTTFFISLTLLTLIPIMLEGYISFYKSKSYIIEQSIKNLNSLADINVEKMSIYLDGIERSVLATQKYYNIVKNLPLISKLTIDKSSPGLNEAYEQINEQFKGFDKALNVSDFMLISPEGRVVYSPNEEKMVLYNKPAPLATKKNLETWSNGLWISEATDIQGTYKILIVVPIKNDRGNLIGFSMAEINADVLYSVISSSIGLGYTGEVVLAALNKNDIVFISPLKFSPGKTGHFKFSIPNKSFNIPMIQATEGMPGSGIINDYVGNEIIAAWRPLQVKNMGMVLKINTSEAFAEVDDRMCFTIWLTILFFVIAIFTAYMISRILSSPITLLNEGMKKIGAGDLEYRVGTLSKNEIGQLSRSFDEMTAKLKETMTSKENLDKEVFERMQKEADLVVSENKLKKAVEDLKKSNAELEQFAYVASHDLQEPLRTISSSVMIIEEKFKGKLDEKTTMFMNFATGGCRRMSELISSLLELSRVSTKAEPFAEFDANKALSIAIGNLMESVRVNNAVITNDKLPVIKADEIQIIQLFQNLLTNSLKFRRKEEAPKIHISCNKSHEGNIFSVEDNGIGIESKHYERIFIMFKRLNSKEDYPGCGIGLSICKKIVDRHYGRIWVESETGKGTKFYFLIP